MESYTQEQVILLACLAAADYATACTGPTIRGLNGETNLRGKSYEEVAANNGISVEEAKRLTIDLSTASFDEMSEHWQNVNIESARAMIALIPLFSKDGVDGATVLRNMDFNIRQAAATVHEAWLKLPQNSWALGGNLDCPFEELSKEDQNKDIQQILSLYTWLCSLDA